MVILPVNFQKGGFYTARNIPKLTWPRESEHYLFEISSFVQRNSYHISGNNGQASPDIVMRSFLLKWMTTVYFSRNQRSPKSLPNHREIGVC